MACLDTGSGAGRLRLHHWPGSGVLRTAQPRCDITLRVQDTPDVDLIVTLDEEDQVRIPLQRPGSQTRHIPFMGIAGRSRLRMASDVAKCLLERIELMKPSAALSPASH